LEASGSIVVGALHHWVVRASQLIRRWSADMRRERAVGPAVVMIVQITRRVADSIVFGGVAASVAVTCLILASLNREAPSESAVPSVMGFVWMLGAPALALTNLAFVIRDWRVGHRKEAVLGLLLSERQSGRRGFRYSSPTDESACHARVVSTPSKRGWRRG
jgi:hypothetical protein